VTLARLSNHINAGRQLTQGTRGVELDPERADTIAAFLRAAQQLARSGEKRGPLAPLCVDTDSRRFRLRRRDPRCLWCGRVTRIESGEGDMAATLDHIHPKGHREGKRLRTVLACRRCNSCRGRPAAKPLTCPLIESVKRAA
jgi:hypothetical protein